MRISILFLLLISSVYAAACTTFLLSRDGHHYFGRNYDWITGNGMVMTNPRQVQKVSSGDGMKCSWTSKYGSITFNQYGKEFPTGGMNEKGLVVELMWLDETIYPVADDRPAFGVLQWVQYQLDNCASVDEVLATDRSIRIGTDNPPLHYLVADATGNVATIEFLDGRMVTHSGNLLTYPVLTNSVYRTSLEKTSHVLEKEQTTTFKDNSLSRFATACSMVSKFQAAPVNDPVHYGFSILHSVAQGSFTKWNIVYDISAKQIHFFTHDGKTKKLLNLADFSFECGEGLARDLNAPGTGNIRSSFKPLTFAQNQNLIETSARESRPNIEISASSIKNAVDFFNIPSCKVAIR